MSNEMIHVFIGTKAQYIKTAPLLRLMDEQGVEYSLIDSGQHADIARVMRAELGVREPDVVVADDGDISTVPDAIRWAARLSTRLIRAKRLRAQVFRDRGGICVVHGDTPSTILSALMAWRAGLRVAHMEAGLRSHNLLHPFPEELIRIVVMRFADILFAPTPDAIANLGCSRHRGDVIALEGNTSIEAVSYASNRGVISQAGPAVVTMHRVENLRNRKRVEGWLTAVEKVAERFEVRFVMHEPTRLALSEIDGIDRLERAGVSTSPLVGHAEFVDLLRAAPLAIIDGGSIQEECGYLGIPTLLWRDHTEREHGLGSNVVLSHFDQSIVDRFLTDLDALRVPVQLPDVNPSEQILSELLSRLTS